MKKALLATFRAIFGAFNILFTGGKYGSSVPSKYSYNYAKSQEQKQKDFEKHGAGSCKICGKRIPADKQYCGACYHKYIKK